MLDVISDFWKPVKKDAAQEKPDFSQLEVGGWITFGNVPQALISASKLRISSINTYLFGEEKMTSYVLSRESGDSVSLIVANIEEEQYLAISRRVPFADRMRMFDPSELESIVEQSDAESLACHEIDSGWKSWMVNHYNREISGLRGAMAKGDYRHQPMPTAAMMQPFDYVLLTSENNEYAIEVERYADGRLELYATIYRRLSDIISIELPESGITTRVAEANATEAKQEENKTEQSASESNVVELPSTTPTSLPTFAAPEKKEPTPAPVAESAKPQAKQASKLPFPPKKAPTPLPHPGASAEEKPSQPAAAAPKPEQPKPQAQPQTQQQIMPKLSPAVSEEKTISPPQSIATEKTIMQPAPQNHANGSSNPQTASAPAAQAQEVAKVNSKIEHENDAIECDLRVANKIIEESIRNEMRMSDVIRRVIALPVANPEAVQIPVTLTESDYQLLAIRYGIAPSDTAAIKSRIIEELNDFSGEKKSA